MYSFGREPRPKTMVDDRAVLLVDGNEIGG